MITDVASTSTSASMCNKIIITAAGLYNINDYYAFFLIHNNKI